MNKIQFIKLLESRGITELKGITIAEAIRKSGGDPTLEEMVKVNEQCMIHYLEKFEEEKKSGEAKLGILEKQIQELKERDEFLSCLEAAGIDNWDGYEYAVEISEGKAS